MDLAELWQQIASAGPLDWSDDLGEAPIGVDEAGWRERVAHQADRRRTFVAFYSWAIPSQEAIAAISAFVGKRKVLEVCAGQGLWALLLAGTGVDVVATDGSNETRPTYFAVELQDAEAAVAAHPECSALMLVWPPIRNDCAYRALHCFQGDCLVYVGDARFTAEARFHHLLESEWLLEQRLMIPAWPNLDDYAYLYRRASTLGTGRVFSFRKG